MRKHVVVFLILMLAFASAGTSALAKRSSARSVQAAAVREEQRLGPKPTPHWYWRWVDWRLGEGYAKGRAHRTALRPHHAPPRIHTWAWRRLHYFLLARNTHGGGPVRNGGETYANATAYTLQHPAFTPRRTIAVRNASGLRAAIANLQPGDLVKATASFTVSGITVIDNRLTSPAELDLDGVRFVYTGGANHPAVWLDNARNLYIYGGNLSTAGTGGTCLTDHGSQYVLWWGFYLHNCGGSGFAAFTAGASVDHNDFEGTVTKVGQTLAWDPHPEKGTGVHGAILWDANTNYAFTNNRFAFNAHDIPTGACVELGNDQPSAQASGNVLYEKCVNETEVASQQTGGNGLQLWGDTDTLGLDVKYLEVDNAQGRALDTQGLYPRRTLRGVTVEYGRASRTNLNPRFAGQNPWDSYGGVVYKQVRPAR
ncbi:MAG TPA: hypothetical protein VFV91_13550 [Gaiellaceae bacterium]|jgi:hypothetical protein|nr:hypothetical protein [Gaiellaceae bacterium]